MSPVSRPCCCHIHARPGRPCPDCPQHSAAAMAKQNAADERFDPFGAERNNA